jgi:amino acid transporter
MNVLRLLLGRRLATGESEAHKINSIEGVPAMGLDALSSAAYGPEAALSMLLPAGVAGLGYIRPVTGAILVLLAVLAASYWQTIAAYPSNGGSYTVASDNLGPRLGILAASALLIDYVLNVAVGISAGIAAVTSAIPELHPWTLPLCLGVLAVITIVNLRGTLEAGIIFSLPAYLYIASFGGILILGIVKTIAAGGTPVAIVAPTPLPAATEGVSLWLLLRAFASGCTAMTGVEAVSNGVNAFRRPTVPHAHRTLAAIVIILGLLLASVAWLAQAYHIGAMDQTQPHYQTVLSQIAGAVIGRGPFYFVAIGSLLAVLSLSANTSFVDFPRICRLLARDGYLPREFAQPGRRLVNSVGILCLAASAGLLLIAFGGITLRLIPLFAVGAFLAFTLSQLGMAVHWRRRGDRLHFAINGVGAVATGIALLIILAAKFVEGAWVVVLAVPLLIALMRSVKRYYELLDRRLREEGPLDLPRGEPMVLIPIDRWDRLADKALGYALRLSRHVTALHLTRLEGDEAVAEERRLGRMWREDVVGPARAAGLPAPRLKRLPSPYRSFTGRLLRYIAWLEKRHPGRQIVVVIPDVVEAHWWDWLLQVHRAMRLQRALLRHGGPNLAVMIVPWALGEPHPEAVIEEEEESPRQRA